MGKKKKEEVIEEVVEAVEEVAVEEAVMEAPKRAATVSNERTFMKGEELELKGLPFEVSKVRGLELVLKRKDIK